MAKTIRRTSICSMAVLLFLLSFQTTVQAGAPDIVQMQTSQLGVSGDQAMALLQGLF